MSVVRFCGFHLRAFETASTTLRWRHNELDGVSDHQPHDCLLNRLFGRRSKKTSKLRVTGLCVGNSPGTGEFPAQIASNALRVTGLCVWNSPGTGEFPAQMASNAENVSIWWRHHEAKIMYNESELLKLVPQHKGTNELRHIPCRYSQLNGLVISCVFLIVNRPLEMSDRQYLYVCNDLAPISGHKCWSCPVITIRWYTGQVYYDAKHRYCRWYNTMRCCYLYGIFAQILPTNITELLVSSINEVWERFKNVYVLLNLTDVSVYKIHIFQCMGNIFCMEFQRVTFEFHTKYLALKDTILYSVEISRALRFKSS